MFRHYRELAKRRHSSIEEEKAKKLTAERKIEELKLARMLGESLDSNSVVKAWQNVVLTSRQKFLGLENKVSGRLGFSEHQRIELRKEIEEALEELSKKQIYERVRPEEFNEGTSESDSTLETPAEDKRSAMG